MLSSEFIRKYTASQRTNNPFEKQCYLFDEGISIVERQIHQALINKFKSSDEVSEILKNESETSNDNIIEKYSLIIDFEELLEKLEVRM